MNAGTTTATCPTCGQEVALGRSRVWIRPDGRIAHVKCDPLPPTPRPASSRRRRPAARQIDHSVAGRAPTVRPDARPVLVMWRRSDPFRYEVTDDQGATLVSVSSATALSAWKRERADVQLVNAASVYEAVRGLATRVGLISVGNDASMRSMGRTRRPRKEH